VKSINKRYEAVEFLFERFQQRRMKIIAYSFKKLKVKMDEMMMMGGKKEKWVG